MGNVSIESTVICIFSLIFNINESKKKFGRNPKSDRDWKDRKKIEVSKKDRKKIEISRNVSKCSKCLEMSRNVSKCLEILEMSK